MGEGGQAGQSFRYYLQHKLSKDEECLETSCFLDDTPSQAHVKDLFSVCILN